MVKLRHNGEVIQAHFQKIINMGYSGRDSEAVSQHIEELAEEGVPAPPEVPMQYPVGPSNIDTNPESISVLGSETSGEAEFAIILVGNNTYIAVASDHTDRALETHSVAKSKAICPNVISTEVWDFETIEDHWDKIELRSWVGSKDSGLYQDATVDEIIHPDNIIDEISSNYEEPLSATAILSGTVPVQADEVSNHSHFGVELYDPVLDRSLGIDYNVNIL